MPRDLHKLPKRIRHRFPIFNTKVYVNSCSQGALSDAVRASYEAYLRDWDEEGAPWEYWVERGEAARATFARLVGAAPDEVAVTTSLSAGVSALASGLRYARRSKVVLTDWEFPTVGQIWHAQEARGARVVHVPEAGDGTIPLEHFERAIDDDTLLVSITHVCYRNGARVDVEAVTRLAHERGALVLLDAYQTIGSLPIDVRELDVDFLAAGVLKYLLGSAGLAFFYARRNLVERSFQIIQQVHESGVAMLVVEQNANMALSIADRGYVLSTGRIVFSDRAAALLENEDLRKAYLGR